MTRAQRTPQSLSKTFQVAVALSVSAAACTYAQNLSEDYSSYSIGETPTATAVNKATVIDGSGTTGSGNAIRLVDTITSGSGTDRSSAIEYNFAPEEASEFSSIKFSFDIYNNKVADSTSSFIMGVGGYDADTGVVLSASADRVFNLEFRTTDDFIRVRGSNNADGTYNYAGGSHIDVYVNDHDTDSISYTDPSSQVQTLAANSGVIYIDNVLIGTVGFAATFTDEGDAGLGRIGFYSGSSVISDFTIDNLTVSAIPEPGTFGLLLGFASLGWIAVKRR